MPQQQAPFLEGKYGWNFGESGWNMGMDENLLKFSFMFDGNVDSIVASLPPVSNGVAHFNSTDNRFYFGVNTVWYSSPCPKSFIFKIKSNGHFYQFNGTSTVKIDNPSEIDSRLDAVELTVASLGTAAFEDVEFFAKQSELDVVSAQSAAYTDSLRSDLASIAPTSTGAGQIGRVSQVIGSIASLRLLDKNSASKHAFVTGYYAQGDGGGGPYYLDASDTTSADDGGLTIVAADGGRWKSALRSLTLTQWGCVGDGVTDDLVQAQRAVDHAAATNGVVLDDLGRNFKLSAPLVVTGTFRSVKFKGIGTGDAQTASSGGSAFLVTGTPNAIEAHFLVFANENIIVEGFNFYNTALDQLNGGTAIKLIRGAANSRYISGFVFRDVGILGFGSAFTFQGMNTIAVENNYWGPILMENVSIQGTGVAFYIKNSVLNLLNMQSVNLLDCKFGGFRLEQDGDVGVGNGKGSAITASLHKCHFEGVGGMFRTQPTTVTGVLGAIRNDISLYDFTHESCGSATGPVAGEPFVLGANNDIHVFGKVDNGIPFGEVSLPRLNTTTRIDSASKMAVWLDGGRSLSPTKVNSPTYYRTVLNGGSTVITVGIDQVTDFAIKSTLILGGGNAGIVESLHQGNAEGAPVRTAIAGAPSAGITLTWGAVAGGGAIQLTVANASGFTITAELQIENLSSSSITAASEV